MNNLFSILSKSIYGVLAIGLIASCNTGNQGTTANVSVDSNSVKSVEKTEKIAYINADSLSEHYEYFKDIKVKLEGKIKKAQEDLQSKGQAFQREVADYQQKASTMSASDRQATEERLARKQDELGRLDQNASASLAQDEATEFNNVYNSITEYLKKHSEEEGYSLVLTYSQSNPTVLYADSKLEITKEVIEALNKEYLKKKSNDKK